MASTAAKNDRMRLEDLVSLDHLLEVVPWDIHRHVREIYEPFRCRGQRLPQLAAGTGGVPPFQQKLMDWKADLGARGKVDWSGLFAKYRSIMQPLVALPRLGELSETDIHAVAEAVSRLEDFKPTKGRKLAFGSKAAHFVFRDFDQKRFLGGRYHIPFRIDAKLYEWALVSRDPKLNAKLNAGGPG